MQVRAIHFICLAALMAIGAGCASNARESTAALAPSSQEVHAALVMNGPMMGELDGGDWETARLDSPMGADRPLRLEQEWTETIARERLWSVSGRPRESSYQTIRSIRRRWND